MHGEKCKCMCSVKCSLLLCGHVLSLLTKELSVLLPSREETEVYGLGCCCIREADIARPGRHCSRRTAFRSACQHTCFHQSLRFEPRPASGRENVRHAIGRERSENSHQHINFYCFSPPPPPRQKFPEYTSVDCH